MRRLPRYEPRQLSAADRRALLVGREALLEGLVDRLARTARGGGARFELLLGPPGIGKSHLLLAAHDAARETLGERARIVLLDGSGHIGPVRAMLASILAALKDGGARGPAELSLEALGAAIRDAAAGQALLVFAEHLDRAFDAMGPVGQRQLRGLLQNEGRWSVVASAQEAAAFTDQRQPFFAMFALRPLEALEASECSDLLLGRARLEEAPETLTAWLDSERGLARARALHALLGGLPRTWTSLGRYLSAERADTLWEALLEVADEWRLPLQERLAPLPSGRRSVLERLLVEGRPLSVSRLTERLLEVTQQTVSSQLGVLRSEGWVRARRVGRESFYEPADPLDRLVGELGGHAERVRKRVALLRAWYRAEGERVDPNLGDFGGQAASGALSAVDWAELGGFDSDALEQLRAPALVGPNLRERVTVEAQARRGFARCNATERRVLRECLEADGVEGY